MSLTLAATRHTRLDAEMESENSPRLQLTKESMSKDAYRYVFEVTQRSLSNLLFHLNQEIFFKAIQAKQWGQLVAISTFLNELLVSTPHSEIGKFPTVQKG